MVILVTDGSHNEVPALKSMDNEIDKQINDINNEDILWSDFELNQLITNRFLILLFNLSYDFKPNSIVQRVNH